MNQPDYFTIGFLTAAKEEVQATGNYDAAETSDGHCKAWHGSFILLNAIEYLVTGKIEKKWFYNPIFTRP
jgi:hypothetical protein